MQSILNAASSVKLSLTDFNNLVTGRNRDDDPVERAPVGPPRGAREPNKSRFSTILPDREHEPESPAPARPRQARPAPRNKPQPVADLASDSHSPISEPQKPPGPTHMKPKFRSSDFGGFKVINTLHQPSAASSTHQHKRQGHRVYGEPSRSTLELRASSGGNVQRTYVPAGSESAKRRRIESTDNSRSHQSSPSRDVNMDERSSPQAVKPHNMAGQTKNSERKRQSSDGFTKGLFTQKEFRTVDKMQNPTSGNSRAKRRRKSETESEMSSHRSHHFDAESVEAVGHQNSSHQSPNDGVVVLEDSQETQARYNKSPLPRIELDRGFDNPEISARHRAAARDNAARNQPLPGPARGNRVRGSPLESAARDERQYPPKAVAGSRRTQEPDKLSKHFIRDDRQTVISTRVSPIDDEKDELDGPPTIRRELQKAAQGSESRTASSASRIREGSPSDLPRTTFTHRQRQRNNTPSVKKRPKTKSVSPPIRIHLKMLYWSTYVLEGVDLVWSDDENAFIVEAEGSHGPKTTKKIGSVVRKWISSASEPYVVLWTSADASERSNSGRIGLKFERLEDKKVCLDKLIKATKETLECEVLTDKPVKSMFDILLKGCVEHQRRISQMAAEEETIQRNAKSRASAVVLEKEEEEAADEIKYEKPETKATPMPREARRPTLKQVLSSPSAVDTIENEPDEAADTGTISSYFQNPRETRRALRSSRNSSDLRPRAVTPPKWTVVNKPEPWQHSVVFPPLPAPRRVTVDFRDLERLDEGEFLNDNVISFALRDIEESMDSEHRKEVYMFNTFFYSSLTTRNGRKAFNYDAVKRWTNKVNIFDYKYVIVPINLDLHWFVAIICNLPDLFAPEKNGIDIEDDEEETQVDGQQPEPSSSNEVIPDSLGEITMTERSSPAPSGEISRLSLEDSTPPKGRVPGSFPEDDEASARQPVAIKRKKSKKKRSHTPRKIPNSDPIIMTLDSFGHSRTAEIRHLKDYLVAEAKDKRGVDLDPKRMQGVTARGIPEQPNFCDCGVYVVEYVQQFAKNPRVFVEKILNRELDKDRDFAEFQPSQRRDLLREKLIQLNKVQEQEYLEKKSKRAAEKAAAKQKREQEQEHEVVRKEVADSPTLPVMKIDDDDDVVSEDATVGGPG